MKIGGRRFAGLLGLLIGVVLATSGCASKKFVSRQIAPVNQRLNQFEKQTNDRIAWMNNKQKNDISQLNERLATTDMKVNEVAQAAQQAQGSASRAMEEATKTRAANSEAISKLESNLNESMNYRLVDSANVMFAFNKATLTPQARATLDEAIAKFQSAPRGVVELEGFTDHSGSSNYNLGLSRRRAWAVQRYLVDHKVPLRSIHLIGMGEGQPAEGIEGGRARSAREERNRSERRVTIRIFGAGEIASASAEQ